MANTELIAQLESLDATELAKWMHEHYELLAQELGWETQKLTRVDYDRLPPENKAVMFRMACSILEKFNLPQILQALRVQEAARHPLMPKAIAHDPLCEVILLPTDNVACDCGARIINAVLDNFHAALQSNQEGG